MPSPSSLLRMLGFMVPSLLALAGLQPAIGAAAGGVSAAWAVGLTAPALVGAVLIFAFGRLMDQGDAVQPPWYSAWVLLPGGFTLTGAASMCIFGALVQFALIPAAMWLLLVVGTVLWSGALVVVRHESK